VWLDRAGEKPEKVESPGLRIEAWAHYCCLKVIETLASETWLGVESEEKSPLFCIFMFILLFTKTFGLGAIRY